MLESGMVYGSRRGGGWRATRRTAWAVFGATMRSAAGPCTDPQVQGSPSAVSRVVGASRRLAYRRTVLTRRTGGNVGIVGGAVDAVSQQFKSKLHWGLLVNAR